MLMDISLFGYYQMFTFANIGPVLDNTVSFKNLINKTRSNKRQIFDEARDQPQPGSFPKKDPGYEVVTELVHRTCRL
jgi:hypothetical protein